MFIKSFAMATAGLAMVAAPVAASAAPANPASSLSVAQSARAGAPVSKKSSKLAGASVIPLVIGAAIIAGAVYLVVDKEDDDSDSN